MLNKTIAGGKLLFFPMNTDGLQLSTKDIMNNPMLLSTVPAVDIEKMKDILIDLGQQILLGVAGVVVVACGILIAVGMKREGWSRVTSIIQGLGVGLIGPTIVAVVAALFAGFAKLIG